MEQAFSTGRFLMVHMLQEEAVLMFAITILLLWVLNTRLAKYSTKTQEAALAKRFAWIFAGAVVTLAVVGRILR